MSYAKRAGTAIRYASRTTGVNFEKWATWGAIGAIGYITLRALGLIGDVKDAANKLGSKIGLAWYDFLHPNEIGETLFHVAQFPDGQFHSVPSGKVNANGMFTNSNLAPNYRGDGQTYQLVKLKKSVTRNGVTTDKAAILKS